MEEEYKLSVYDIMQNPVPSGRTSEDGSPAGDTVRKLILDNWEKYEKLSIYFDGIVQMTRPFCDEAFAKILEERSLEDFNEKLFFPDSNDRIVKQLNDALKIRMKIIKSKKEREDMQA
ncbi:MAG TPA: DUF4325 domain-containing protein [Nitrospinaceae bacterium]|jgi:hypothetical protein|nr:DUF4325 domain-containing protein [Nitrospinaceae bacterium]MDP7108660.1 DUF4325 domain-containing protein [Nitrospinaceae bacterium]HJL72364.1 DUF4325 domain-containing protein [Nitrospinaceae bacterium]HJO01221.1 DUF4325 domain-containing protein [Nitrospinaceae bacterium]|tara:strand:- start:963 stop:1316 length:354 start_codon:yes stop_codon:yes gene_type:complete